MRDMTKTQESTKIRDSDGEEMGRKRLLINYVLLASSVYRNWLKATFTNLLRLRLPSVWRPAFDVLFTARSGYHSLCYFRADYVLRFLYCFISILLFNFYCSGWRLDNVRQIRHSQILNSFHWLFVYVAEELGGRERLAVFICELVRVYECCLDRCPFKRKAYQTLPIVMVAVLEDKRKNITHLIKSYR